MQQYFPPILHKLLMFLLREMANKDKKKEEAGEGGRRKKGRGENKSLASMSIFRISLTKKPLYFRHT